MPYEGCLKDHDDPIGNDCAAGNLQRERMAPGFTAGDIGMALW